MVLFHDRYCDKYNPNNYKKIEGSSSADLHLNSPKIDLLQNNSALSIHCIITLKSMQGHPLPG